MYSQTTETSALTLRDYFAAKALQGQIAPPLKLSAEWENRLIAERAYRIADAMLKAREQEPKE